MLEAIKHLFGFCGDGHPSILYFIGSIPIIFSFRLLVTSYVKNLLEHFGLKHRQNKIQD